MKFDYIDIHSHVNFSDFDEDREAVIARMKEASVATITVGVDVASSKSATLLAEKNDNIWVSIGQHPQDNPKERFDAEKYEALVKHPKVVSIGECGLDYFRISSRGGSASGGKGDIEKEKKRQKKDFEAQIVFAILHNKPLMLHCRPSKGSYDAYHEAIEMLSTFKREHGDKLRGNFHFFAGDVDVARRSYELNFTTSFPGVITFTSDYDDVVKFAPMDMIHAETDAPFAAPVPYRGKRNEPLYVIEVVKKIAEIREEDEEKIREQLLENAKRLYKLE